MKRLRRAPVPASARSLPSARQHPPVQLTPALPAAALLATVANSPLERQPAAEPVLALQRQVGNQWIARQVQAGRSVQRIQSDAVKMIAVPEEVVGTFDAAVLVLKKAIQQWQARKHLLSRVLHDDDIAKIPAILEAMEQQAALMKPVAWTETMQSKPNDPYAMAGYRVVDDPEVGGEAYTEGDGAGALITIFTTGIKKGKDNLVVTLLHELSHATPGIDSQDYAYYQDRFYRSIRAVPGLAVRNAESLAHTIALLGDIDFDDARESGGYSMVGMDAFAVLKGKHVLPVGLGVVFDQLQGVFIAAHTTMKTVASSEKSARTKHLSTILSMLPMQLKQRIPKLDVLGQMVFAIFEHINGLMGRLNQSFYFQVSSDFKTLTITTKKDSDLGKTIVQVPGALADSHTIFDIYSQLRGNPDYAKLDWPIVDACTRLAGSPIP